jgi:hypothetical protein
MVLVAEIVMDLTKDKDGYVILSDMLGEAMIIFLVWTSK